MFEIVSNLSCVPFGVQGVIVAAKWLRNEYYDEKSPQLTFEKNGRRTEQSQADHKVRGPKASSSWNHRLNSMKAQNKKEFSLRLGHLVFLLQLFFLLLTVCSNSSQACNSMFFIVNSLKGFQIQNSW